MELYGFERSNPTLFDLAIVQRETDGGKTSREQIDRIQEHPEARSLMISGLDQESFAYLIQRYGRQFRTLSFWKNKLVCDLSLWGICLTFNLLTCFLTSGHRTCGI